MGAISPPSRLCWKESLRSRLSTKFWVPLRYPCKPHVKEAHWRSFYAST